MHLVVGPSKEECSKRRGRLTDADQVDVMEVPRDEVDDAIREYSAFRLRRLLLLAESSPDIFSLV